MNKHLQVRNMTPDLHRKVKVRAAEEGLTITDWVTRLLEREVEKPNLKEWAARLRQRPSIKLDQTAAEIVREDRDGR